MERKVLGIGIADSMYTYGVCDPFNRWYSMLVRCYRTSYRQPTYEECTVSEEWLDFSNFLDWYTKNYYQCFGERMDLDKDILVKGNKIYGPETCVFAPQRINVLFTIRKRKYDYLPIGVELNTNNARKYNMYIRLNGRNIKKSNFNSPEEAFAEYKRLKELEIKRVANEYKEKIPKRLYDAMLRYEVEIDD